MKPHMKYKDRDISFKSSKPSKRNAIVSSTEDDESTDSSYNLSIASSTVSKKDHSERNGSKQIFEKSQNKQARDIQSNSASSHSLDSDDSTSPIFEKRKRACSRDISSKKRECNALPIVVEQHSGADNNSYASSSECTIIDVENTNQNHSAEFKSYLAQVLYNINKLLSTYGSRLRHLKKKYCDNESSQQDDFDNVMFILGCIMSKLKDDLDTEEKSLKMSYGCQKQLQPPCATIEKQVDQMSDRLESENNETIILYDDESDVTPPDVQEKLTLPETSKNAKQLVIRNETIAHTQSEESENSSICETSSNETNSDANMDVSTNNVTNIQLPLSHLTEISKESTPQSLNKIDGNCHYKKQSTILKSIQEGSGRMVQSGQRSGYDSDISTCSTIICRKAPKTDSTSVTNKNLTSQRYGTLRSEVSTNSTTIPKKRKKSVYIISDSDSDSTYFKGDNYPLQSSSETVDYDWGFPSNRKTVQKETPHSLSYLGSQIFRRTSPVLVQISAINNSECMNSEDEIDDIKHAYYIAQKHKKNIIQNDIKLQMKCVVELSQFKLNSSGRYSVR